MIKVNPTTYIELFKEFPNMEMVLSGWEYEVRYFLFSFISIIIYKKP